MAVGDPHGAGDARPLRAARLRFLRDCKRARVWPKPPAARRQRCGGLRGSLACCGHAHTGVPACTHPVGATSSRERRRRARCVVVPAAVNRLGLTRHAAAHMQAVGRRLLDEYAPGAQQEFGYHLPPFNSVDHLHLHCFALPFTPSWKVYKYTTAGIGCLWYLPSSTLLEVRWPLLLLRWRPLTPHPLATALGRRSGRRPRGLLLNGRHALTPCFSLSHHCGAVQRASAAVALAFTGRSCSSDACCRRTS